MSSYMDEERWLIFRSTTGRIAFLPESTIKWLKYQSPVEQDEFLDYWFSYEEAAA